MTHAVGSAPVLIVGSMAFDDLELPSGKFTDVIAGAATYASIAASLFAPVRVVAVVGDDFPQAALDRLAARGVDTSGIERASGKTFRWAGRYADNLASRTTLDTQLNVFADFRPRLPAAFRDSPFVLLANIHPALQLDVLGQVQAPRFVAADTMNFWIEGERALLLQVIAKVDALIINDEELRQLAGVHNVTRAARTVLALGPKRLIVKRGEYGALLFERDSVHFSPAFPLEDEVDPTGAGDAFAGSLMGYLATEPTLDSAVLRRAMAVGAAVASACVEGVGTGALAAVDRHAVAARLAALRALV